MMTAAQKRAPPPPANDSVMPSAEDIKARMRYLRRLSALRIERSTWDPTWRDLCLFFLPRAARFLSTDRNKGTRKDGSIINNVGTRSIHTLGAGIQSGITNPARNWFKVGVSDPELNDSPPVKDYCQKVTDLVHRQLARSNFYNSMPPTFEELGLLGTSVLVMEEDAKTAFRFYGVPVGQYFLASSRRRVIDTLYREISMTVGQLVEEFGLENCSPWARNHYKNGRYDIWCTVLHAVEPNNDQIPNKLDFEGKPWRSVWLETGSQGNTNPAANVTDTIGGPIGFLRQEGFNEFPALTPRWQVTAEDVYGLSPALDCLGDVKALQIAEKRLAQAVDKTVNPPMKGPASMRSGRASLLPGDFTVVDTVSGGQTFEPAMVINPGAIAAIKELIQELSGRISETLYANLWVMFEQIERAGLTATEVNERKEEKLLQLGPVVDRLKEELLSPIIERAILIMHRKGMLPAPPPELKGHEFSFEYVSLMDQAQKAFALVALQSLLSFATALAQVRPDAVDPMDVDAMMNEAADVLGVKPSMLLPQEKVDALRQARAAQQQAAQQGQSMAVGAKAMKDASGADMSGDNGLTRMLQTLGPTAATAGRAA